MIPVHKSVRGILFASVCMSCLSIFIIINNSKVKSKYECASGEIEYLDTVYYDLPKRHKGDYRFLKISSYPYVFRIFEPNSESTTWHIDDMKVGDTVDVYYYETRHSRKIRVNRFVQFIDRDKEPVFIRNHFQRNLGYILLYACMLLNVMSYMLWKTGKIRW